MLPSDLHDASVERNLDTPFVRCRHDGIGSSTRRGGYTCLEASCFARVEFVRQASSKLTKRISTAH
jgi:hypothetical protein